MHCLKKDHGSHIPFHNIISSFFILDWHSIPSPGGPSKTKQHDVITGGWEKATQIHICTQTFQQKEDLHNCYLMMYLKMH